MSERTSSAAGWTFLDQAASTASNFVVLLVAAHMTGEEGVQAFTYGFTAYLAVLGINRAIVLYPLLSHPERGPVVEDSTALGLSLALGLMAAVSLGAGGLWLDRDVLIAVGLLTPGLLLQDAVRFVAFRRQIARSAFLVDFAWLLLVCVSILLPFPVDGLVITMVWAVAGGLAGLGGLLLIATVPWLSLERVRSWRHMFGRYGSGLFLDAGLFTLGQQVLLLGVVELSKTDAALAEVRVGQSLLGPLPALFTVLNMLVLPRLAQGEMRSRLVTRMRVVALVAAALWVGVLALGRELISAGLLDDAVGLTATVLLLLAAQVLLQAYMLPLIARLRALRRSKELLLARLVATLSAVPAFAFVVATPTASAMAAALTAQTIVYAVTAVWMERRSAR